MYASNALADFAEDSQFGCTVPAHGSAAATPIPIPTKARKRAVPWPPILALVVAFLILGWVLPSLVRRQPVAPESTLEKSPPDHTIPIGGGALTVPAGQYAFYTLTIPHSANSVYIRGHFQSDGNIQVYLLNSQEFADWKNGNETSWYLARGNVSVGDIYVSLPDGAATYYLVFRNNSRAGSDGLTFNGSILLYEPPAPCCSPVRPLPK